MMGECVCDKVENVGEAEDTIRLEVRIEWVPGQDCVHLSIIGCTIGNNSMNLSTERVSVLHDHIHDY